jgi:hypothetical protein
LLIRYGEEFVITQLSAQFRLKTRTQFDASCNLLQHIWQDFIYGCQASNSARVVTSFSRSTVDPFVYIRLEPPNCPGAQLDRPREIIISKSRIDSAATEADDTLNLFEAKNYGGDGIVRHGVAPVCGHPSDK